MKIFANSQRVGFKRALEHVELSESELVCARSVQGMQWEFAKTANVKLSDFLQRFTSDDALRVVEAYPDQGFEACRRHNKCYSLAGGRYVLSRIM